MVKGRKYFPKDFVDLLNYTGNDPAIIFYKKYFISQCHNHLIDDAIQNFCGAELKSSSKVLQELEEQGTSQTLNNIKKLIVSFRRTRRIMPLFFKDKREEYYVDIDILKKCEEIFRISTWELPRCIEELDAQIKVVDELEEFSKSEGKKKKNEKKERLDKEQDELRRREENLANNKERLKDLYSSVYAQYKEILQSFSELFSDKMLDELISKVSLDDDRKKKAREEIKSVWLEVTSLIKLQLTRIILGQIDNWRYDSIEMISEKREEYESLKTDDPILNMKREIFLELFKDFFDVLDNGSCVSNWWKNSNGLHGIYQIAGFLKSGRNICDLFSLVLEEDNFYKKNNNQDDTIPIGVDFLNALEYLADDYAHLYEFILCLESDDIINCSNLLEMLQKISSINGNRGFTLRLRDFGLKTETDFWLKTAGSNSIDQYVEVARLILQKKKDEGIFLGTNVDIENLLLFMRGTLEESREENKTRKQEGKEPIDYYKTWAKILIKIEKSTVDITKKLRDNNYSKKAFEQWGEELTSNLADEEISESEFFQRSDFIGLTIKNNPNFSLVKNSVKQKLQKLQSFMDTYINNYDVDMNDEKSIEQYKDNCKMFVRFYEEIHPLADKNGRTSRLLYNIFLRKKGLQLEIPYANYLTRAEYIKAAQDEEETFRYLRIE